jgi:hypothetical protein
VLILVAGRSLTFFFDEWTWITDRRTPSVDAFLVPHNEHLSLVPVALYEALFHTVGLVHYWPYRMMILVAHVGVAALTFAYLRQRLQWGVALAGATLVLGFGAAYQVILWPFQTSFALSLVGVIGMLMLLDRRRQRADVGASAMGVLALASSGVGVPLVAAAGLELVLRRQWRRLWVVLVPVALYGLWYVRYGERTGAADGVVGTTRWAIEFAGASVGGILGMGSKLGQLLLVPLALVCWWGVARADRERRPRVIALMAMPVSYWVLIALGRSGFQDPDTSRYLYAGGVLTVLVVGECCTGLVVRRAAAVFVAVVTVLAVVMGTADLFSGGDELRVVTRQTLATVSAIDIGTRTLDPGYVAVRTPPPIDGRPTVAAFDALGSPALDTAGVRAMREENRRQADGFLAAVVGMTPTGATPAAGDPPRVRRLTRGQSEPPSEPSCVRLAADGGGVDVEVASSTPYLRVESLGEADVEVRLRAFANGYFGAGAPFVTLPGGEARDVPTPRSDAPPWRVGLRSADAIEVCGTDGPGPR